MTKTPDDEPIDVTQVKADDELVESMRDGETPDGLLGQMLGAYRDDAQGK